MFPKEREEGRKDEDSNDPIPYVLLSCFYKTWKRDYPKLKVIHAVADICEQCFKSANRHTHLAQHQPNLPSALQLDSALDDILFRAESDNDSDDDSEAPPPRTLSRR